MPFKDHFSRLARQYLAFRPLYPAPLFDYVASLCREQRCAWDCACGSGQATLPLAGRFDSVIGTDASARQIAAAPSHPKVTYRVAGAEHSGLDTASVDLITVAQSLHWFDLELFYREVERVLSETGVLAVWSYGVLHVDGGDIDPIIQTFYYDTVGDYWPPERWHVDDAYRSLPFPFAETAPPPFSMQERWPLAHLLGYLRSWSATGRYIDRHGRDPVATLHEKLERVWGDPTDARLVTWPLLLRAGRKH
jgi:SAM-dependent methyltransferase